MSSSRIYRCLASTACGVSARGKEVFKYGALGSMAGAVAGATLGGLSVGFHDAVLLQRGKDEFRAAHDSEYPAKCHKDGGNEHCERPEFDAAQNAYGLDYAKQEIAKVGPWIAIWCTVGGAAAGLLTGAIHGWRKPLAALSVEEHDLEAQNPSPGVAYNRI